MNITKQLYTANDDGGLAINYDFNSSGQALNLTGFIWVDSKYGFIKKIIGKHMYLITDTDLLSHEDYIDCLTKNHTVIFISKPGRKRIKRAIELLKSADIKTKYFVNQDALVRYIEKK